MPRQARESSGTGIYHVMMLALSYEPEGTPGGRNYGITDMTQEERWLAKYTVNHNSALLECYVKFG